MIPIFIGVFLPIAALFWVDTRVIHRLQRALADCRTKRDAERDENERLRHVIFRQRDRILELQQALEQIPYRRR